MHHTGRRCPSSCPQKSNCICFFLMSATSVRNSWTIVSSILSFLITIFISSLAFRSSFFVLLNSSCSCWMRFNRSASLYCPTLLPFSRSLGRRENNLDEKKIPRIYESQPEIRFAFAFCTRWLYFANKWLNMIFRGRKKKQYNKPMFF